MTKKECFLGVDIGSISTKGILIDKSKNIIGSIYVRSKNIESSLKTILNHLLKDKIEIKGVGCTGSGREYAQSLIGADITKTEIIAHAIGNLYFYPKVRTIVDIGGEDSKLIILEDGVLKDFSMNTICSSGMGATMENIAVRLGIKIEEFGSIALKSNKTINLPMKCGVLMSSAVVSKKNQGEKIENILMGVAKAVARNFLALNAKGKDLLEPIVFCGMTAYNKALVNALEEETEKKIIVPENPEMMGAFGIALITMEEMNDKKTSFQNKLTDSKNYKIECNRKDCISCGNCFSNAPDYFTKSEDGKTKCIKEIVEQKDLEKIKEICENCPMKLINLRSLLP